MLQPGHISYHFVMKKELPGGTGNMLRRNV